MNDQESRDNFLARWSRRKVDVASTEAEISATPPEGEQDTAAPAAEPFDLASLPSLSQITAQTDMRPFMNALVPESLRNAALRRVWEADPAIRDYIGPATEYAWDWHRPGGVQGYGPLELGDKALELAERMFSTKIDDESLVEGKAAQKSGPGIAPANEIAPTPPLPLPLPPAAGNGGELTTVRISIKTDDYSDATPPRAQANPDRPEILAQSDKIIAPQQSASRHGKASPR